MGTGKWARDNLLIGVLLVLYLEEMCRQCRSNEKKKTAYLENQRRIFWMAQVKPYLNFLRLVSPAYTALCKGVLFSLGFHPKKISCFMNATKKKNIPKPFEKFATALKGHSTELEDVCFVNVMYKLLHFTLRELASRGLYMGDTKKIEIFTHFTIRDDLIITENPGARARAFFLTLPETSMLHQKTEAHHWIVRSQEKMRRFTPPYLLKRIGWQRPFVTETNNAVRSKGQGIKKDPVDKGDFDHLEDYSKVDEPYEAYMNHLYAHAKRLHEFSSAVSSQHSSYEREKPENLTNKKQLQKLFESSTRKLVKQREWPALAHPVQMYLLQDQDDDVDDTSRCVIQETVRAKITEKVLARYSVTEEEAKYTDDNMFVSWNEEGFPPIPDSAPFYEISSIKLSSQETDEPTDKKSGRNKKYIFQYTPGPDEICMACPETSGDSGCERLFTSAMASYCKTKGCGKEDIEMSGNFVSLLWENPPAAFRRLKCYQALKAHYLAEHPERGLPPILTPEKILKRKVDKNKEYIMWCNSSNNKKSKY